MNSILKGNELIVTFVLTNMCIAFAVLSEYSPATSRPYLVIAATALGMFALYPLFIILQHPRRFVISKETENDKTLYVVKYKGYLWWYTATDRKGNDAAFNTMDEAQRFIKEEVVTKIIAEKERRKSFKKEIEVLIDSKKLSYMTEIQHSDNQDENTNQHSPKDETQREEIIPDNDATINGLKAMANNQKPKDGEEFLNNDEEVKSEEYENGNSINYTNMSETEAEPGRNNNENNEDDNEKNAGDGNTSDSAGEDEQVKPNPNLTDVNSNNGNINEQIFDVLEKFGRSDDNKIQSPPQKFPDLEKVTDKENSQEKKSMEQVYEEQTLVHAHQAQTITDALGKILFHQQMVEKKEENNETVPRPPDPLPLHKRNQTTSKGKTKRNNSKDGIPTKNIQRKPSSEEDVLKRRQMSFHEMPNFDQENPDGKQNSATNLSNSHTKVLGDTENETNTQPVDDSTGKKGSSGGHKIKKKLETTDNTPKTSFLQTTVDAHTNVEMSHDQDEVFTRGSEKQTEEPPENDNDNNQEINQNEYNNYQDAEDDDLPPSDYTNEDDGDTLPL